MTLSVLADAYAVCRLDAGSPVPAWAAQGSFYSITKTDRELSIVCGQSHVPENTKAEKNWKALKIDGTLDFSLTGILASIATPLAAAKISIFAISTFDTDYVMVNAVDLERAIDTLRTANFTVNHL